ncbi:hypothetical protein FQA47_015477 [Oryzias melastigma]|uniref:Uncharacterized protein n=1 Tax=Oryzias melastigma TaxID=30732 RepID=A0A834FQB4_ORYME|nr:hypothetical protein FQA47_015477 [Oryzias melastigma]
MAGKSVPSMAGRNLRLWRDGRILMGGRYRVGGQMRKMQEGRSGLYRWLKQRRQNGTRRKRRSQISSLISGVVEAELCVQPSGRQGIRRV